MLKKIKYIFFLSSFFIFIISTISFYFSDKNVMITNKTRSNYLSKSTNDISNLPLLKSDTSNIIEYRTDIEDYKKKKKNYSFWNLIGK